MMNFQLLDAAATGQQGSMMGLLLPMILMFAVLYFFMIRPQKKREKETQKMRSSLEVGDEIITIGGIVGIVASMREDTLVIETGSDRSKIRVARWAVQQNLTAKEAAAPAEKEKK